MQLRIMQKITGDIMAENKVLIVDDEKDILDLISDIVEDAGYKAVRAKNSQQTFEKVSEERPEAIILDIWLKESELDGLGILEFLKKKYSDLPIIMISGHGNIETALRSLKLGAYDYIEKPFKEDKLVNTLNKAVEFSRLNNENKEFRSKTSEVDFLHGDSNIVKNLCTEIDRVAKTESRVFLEGQIGTGKELIAKKIHQLSRRADNKFIRLDLYDYNENEIEAVLFGTEDDGKLNSPARKVGLLELANEGTLYISEVCDIPKACQNRLVKFLTDGKFTRVGGKKEVASNVRVISTSNRDIQIKIRDGEFRGDLYHRLNVVPLEIPSLSERREDIPGLIKHFTEHFSKRYNLPKREFTGEAMISMQSYDWPGNVRQLLNVTEWLLIVNPEDKDVNIKTSMLPKEIVSSSAGDYLDNNNNKELMSLKLREARQVFERQYLLAQINRFGGNISRTASFVGMERSALHRKLKSLHLGKGNPKVAGEQEDVKTASVGE
jgi:two-component system nitrogen regulation response regulator NtrX